MARKSPASTKFGKGRGRGYAPGPRYLSVLQGADISLQPMKNPMMEKVDMWSAHARAGEKCEAEEVAETN